MGFSSQRITLMIHFLSNVTSMVAPTWCHGPFEGTLFRVNADWPTSEFTHFNLVICLSIVNSPLFYDVSPLLPSLRTLGQFRFCSSEAVRNSHKLSYSATATEQLQGSMKGVRFMPAGVVYFLLMVFWWGWTYRAPNSSELEQLFQFMWLDRLPSPWGSNARLFRIELNPINCCFLTSLHQLVPHLAPNFPPALL